MEKKKYSSTAHEEVAQFLLRNGMKFICTESLYGNEMRIFFWATEEQAGALITETGWVAIPEINDWTFAHWKLLK
ncbi:MAG: hypothetical protein K2G53_05990 [Muribaculaceae bacterium]|nr:hypothetical protein [Muribaculaceae bacterium]